MVEPCLLTFGHDVLLCDGALSEAPAVEWFDPEHWARAGVIAHETSGRGSALVVERGADRWVLRHYHRGGLVANFVVDHYLWLGIDRTRSLREWRLLRRLHEAGLPVPKPIAAHVRRSGLAYTADILTAYLPDTRKLSAYLAEGQAPVECWSAIGAMLRDVHDHGADHPDLTAHNILLDTEGRVFLVDFDNARLRPAGAWQRAGLERLHRSLRKVALETGTEFDPAAWQRVVAAYEAQCRDR